LGLALFFKRDGLGQTKSFEGSGVYSESGIASGVVQWSPWVMKIVVFGATGKIGSLLVPLLLKAGHAVVAYARSAEKAAPLKELGAIIELADLEAPIQHEALSEADACVFTAGSGASTGKDKTLTIDLWGAIKTIRACEQMGVRRYLMVSALKARDIKRGHFVKT
jgi:uncharacterized protein YbjT (DUF2867 family)